MQNFNGNPLVIVGKSREELIQYMALELVIGSTGNISWSTGELRMVVRKSFTLAVGIGEDGRINVMHMNLLYDPQSIPILEMTKIESILNLNFKKNEFTPLSATFLSC